MLSGDGFKRELFVLPRPAAKHLERMIDEISEITAQYCSNLFLRADQHTLGEILYHSQSVDCGGNDAVL